MCLQMLIDVTHKVIIFDEAHNMEDCAREAASLTITSEELDEVVKEIEEICEWPLQATVHKVCHRAA